MVDVLGCVVDVDLDPEDATVDQLSPWRDRIGLGLATGVLIVG